MSNWRLVVDEKNLKIQEDWETEDKCHDFWTTNPIFSGYGSVSTTREKCINKILKKFKQEIVIKEKELNKLKKNYEKLEKAMKDER